MNKDELFLMQFNFTHPKYETYWVTKETKAYIYDAFDNGVDRVAFNFYSGSKDPVYYSARINFNHVVSFTCVSHAHQ